MMTMIVNNVSIFKGDGGSDAAKDDNNDAQDDDGDDNGVSIFRCLIFLYLDVVYLFRCLE